MAGLGKGWARWMRKFSWRETVSESSTRTQPQENKNTCYSRLLREPDLKEGTEAPSAMFHPPLRPPASVLTGRSRDFISFESP